MASDTVLGQRINMAMSQKGWSLSKLEKEAAKYPDAPAYATIQKIVDGTTKNPGIDNVAVLAKALDVSVDYLVGLTENTEDSAAQIAANIAGVFNFDPVGGSLTIDKALNDYLVDLHELTSLRESKNDLIDDDMYELMLGRIKDKYSRAIRQSDSSTSVGSSNDMIRYEVIESGVKEELLKLEKREKMRNTPRPSAGMPPPSQYAPTQEA